VKIPKAQRDSQVINVFFVLLGSACIKAEHKTLVKLTPDDAQQQQYDKGVKRCKR